MRRRMGVGLFAIVATMALVGAGCAHEPIGTAGLEDPATSYPPPSHRAAHEPYGTVVVRGVHDTRPSREVGRENYLKESWYSDALFSGSVAGLFESLVTRELVRGGLFERGGDVESAQYLVDLRIRHFGASADRDLIGLIPVIPSIEMTGVFDVEVVVGDIEGRRFSERRYRFEESTLVAGVVGVERVAADLLLELLGRFFAELLPAVDQDVTAFWQELGLAVPRRH